MGEKEEEEGAVEVLERRLVTIRLYVSQPFLRIDRSCLIEKYPHLKDTICEWLGMNAIDKGYVAMPSHDYYFIQGGRTANKIITVTTEDGFGTDIMDTIKGRKKNTAYQRIIGVATQPNMHSMTGALRRKLQELKYIDLESLEAIKGKIHGWSTVNKYTVQHFCEYFTPEKKSSIPQEVTSSESV